MRQIYIGDILISDNGLKIDQTYLYEARSLISESLTADEFTFVAYADRTSGGYLVTEGQYEVIEGDYFVIDSGLADLMLPYGTPVTLYENGNLIGKYYVYEVQRESKISYRVTAYSAIGLLVHQTHYGGVYTTDSATTAGAIVADIMGTLDYSIDNDVAATLVYGHLPIQSKRDSLRDLCLGIGANVFKDANGDIDIKFNKNYTPVSIPDNRVYIDNRYFTQKTYATIVNVTEWGYHAFASDNTVTLFDNNGQSTADHVFVAFKNPCHDLTASGLTINESGANYAVVSGTGTLTGKEYTITQQVLTTSVNMGAVETRQINLTDNHLVSFLNSKNVLARLAAFYSKEQELQSDIVVSGEECGLPYSITNIDETTAVGYLTSLDSLFSSVRKGTAKFITDWSPSNFGNNYLHYDLLTSTSADTWVLPEGATSIRVVIAAGGQGSEGGHGGETGGRYGLNGWDKTGTIKGGEGGRAGSGGKVLIVDIDSPAASYSYQCGTGGAGGTGGTSDDSTPPTIGTDGGDSTFGTYTSADGSVLEGGYINPLSSDRYSYSGETGYSGANAKALVNNGKSPTVGDDFDTWTGGAIGTNLVTTPKMFAYGGSGGGAAYGSNGYDGANGTYVSYYRGGDGGAGANASAPSAQSIFGCGANGGNGGGGGGYGGLDGENSEISSGYGGTGGLGSAGAQGGQGYIIVFY